MVYYRYRLKRLIRNKSLFFWSIIFPIILATFFKLAFSSLTAKDTAFKTIPVAVVQEDGDAELVLFLTEMENGEEKFFDVITVETREEAEKLLFSEEVTAIIVNQMTPELLLVENGLSSTVVKTVLDGYLQSKELIMDAIAEGKIAQVAAALSSDTEVLAEREFNGRSTDPMLQYFQALIAMASLYGALYGLLNAQELRAATSPLAARRVVSPMNKVVTIATDVAAAFTIQFLQFLILLAYYFFVLHIDFGLVNGYLFLAGAMFSLFGVLIGYFIGCAVKKESIQDSIIWSSVMTSCFLGGLMVGNMRIILEVYAPWVNRVNPATLVANALHKLCIMGDMEGYWNCIVSIILWCVALIAGCLVCLFLQQNKGKKEVKTYENGI